MKTTHRQLIRQQDEYACAYCGKTWPADDADPPECSRSRAVLPEIPVRVSYCDALPGNRLKAYLFRVEGLDLGTVVYAPNFDHACTFFARATANWLRWDRVRVSTHLFTAMNKYAHGEACRFELNPENMADASLNFRCDDGIKSPVVSIVQLVQKANAMGSRT